MCTCSMRSVCNSGSERGQGRERNTFGLLNISTVACSQILLSVLAGAPTRLARQAHKIAGTIAKPERYAHRYFLYESRELGVVSSPLAYAGNRNTQNTGGPPSTLRFSLPFSFLRLSLFGHAIAPWFHFSQRRVQPTDKNGYPKNRVRRQPGSKSRIRSHPSPLAL
jgi:hypothetical protein